MIYLITMLLSIFIISLLYKISERSNLIEVSKFLTKDLSDSYSVKKINEYTVHIFAHSNVIDFNVVTNGSYQVGNWCMSNNKIICCDTQYSQFKNFIAQIRKLMYN